MWGRGEEWRGGEEGRYDHLLSLLQPKGTLCSQLLLGKGGLLCLALQPASARVHLGLQQAGLGRQACHLLLLLEQQLLQLLQLCCQLQKMGADSVHSRYHDAFDHVHLKLWEDCLILSGLHLLLLLKQELLQLLQLCCQLQNMGADLVHTRYHEAFAHVHLTPQEDCLVLSGLHLLLLLLEQQLLQLCCQLHTMRLSQLQGMRGKCCFCQCLARNALLSTAHHRAQHQCKLDVLKLRPMSTSDCFVLSGLPLAAVPPALWFTAHHGGNLSACVQHWRTLVSISDCRRLSWNLQLAVCCFCNEKSCF